MKVPEKVYTEWKRLYDHGDQKAICEETGYSRPTISTAIKSGECSEEVMKAIAEFYKGKREKQKEVADELISQMKD